MSALNGLRVVEFANGLAGAVAGMLLADYGAQVVKICPQAPVPDGPTAFRHRNKFLLVADPARPADDAAIAGCLRGADVIILADQWASQTLPAALQQALDDNAGAILARLPTTWSDAPAWAGDVESHGLLSAYAAISARQLSTDGSPVEMIGPWILYVHGIWAAAGLLSALYAKGKGEAGQQIEVSGVQAAILTSAAALQVDPNAPEPSAKFGAFGKHPSYRPFRAGCGRWIASGALGTRFVTAFLNVLGLGDMIDDPRLHGNAEAIALPGNFAWATERIEAAFLTDTVAGWEAKFRAAGIPVEPVQTRRHLLHDPQVTANGMDWQLDVPGWGHVATPATPAILSRTPPALHRLADRALPHWAPRPRPDRAGHLRAGPLQGVRVLNLGTFVATPMAGFLLAELGADVIKVEDLAGDSFRATGYASNRGMRSLAVNLRRPQGLALFRRLSTGADVVINGMRPGVMASMGLDHDSLAPGNPRLISVSLSAYGTAGPKAQLPGVDMVIQGLTGIMAAQGREDAPFVSSAAYVDVTSACISAFATALALVERKQSGRGQAVEEALLRTAVFMQGQDVTALDGRCDPPQGDTDYKGPGPGDRLYQLADGWIRIAAPDPAAVCQVLGLAPGADLVAALAGQDCAGLAARLHRAGIAAVPVRRIADILRDPRFIMSGHLVLARGEQHAMPLAGRLIAFSGGQQGELLLPPGTGEHSRDILRAAQWAEAEIQDLVDQDIIRTGGPMPRRFGLVYR